MPNLLNVNNYHYRRGGSDVVYFEHAELMASLGWQNAYFSMHHPKNAPTSWSRYFIDEIEFGHAYSVIEKARMAAKVIYSLEARNKLAQLLDAFPADIAHLHCIYHHLSPAILPLLSESGMPVVMTAHDLKIACPAYKMLNQNGICERCKGGHLLNVVRQRCIHESLAASAIVALESILHTRLQTYRRHLTKIIVPSRFFLEKFVEWGWPRDKFAYIPNYVSVDRFEPAYAPGDYFLYFGRLAVEKGVATLLRAAAATGTTIKIAGTGPEEVRLRALAADLGAHADFLGYLSGAPLHRLIAGARAVVLPSEWYENAPMCVLESYALGKPVIGADIGGIPEMINHGETGWLFESGNTHALGQVLREAVALPGTAVSDMGRAARAMVASRFSQERYVESILQLYSSLLSHAPVRTPAPAAIVPSQSN
jgi:glycosyltransferase involved in cell wall biosynthesis